MCHQLSRYSSLSLIALIAFCTAPALGAQLRSAVVLVPVLDPPPNAAGWNNTNVRLDFTCGQAEECPGGLVFDAEGKGQRVARTARDRSGRTLDANVVVNIDRTPPVVHIDSTREKSFGVLAVSATAVDDVSGVGSVECNGRSASLVGSAVTCELPWQDGFNDVAVTAIDAAGRRCARLRQSCARGCAQG